MERPLVEILMATYNGQAFLEEQIKSLRNQTYTNWRALVHDDGSTDGTTAIIKRYAAIDERIQLIEDGVTGLGPCANFLYLLKLSTAEFCMFCDQDDIWLNNKIEKLFSVLRGVDGPAAAYSNLYYYKEGRPVPTRAIRIHPSELRNTLFLNGGILGCSLIFNRRLIDSLEPVPKFVTMHDHLITLAAVAFGKLLYTEDILGYYRQHSHNVTGNQKIKALDIMRSFLFSKAAVIDREHYQAVKSFYTAYRGRLSAEEVMLFKAYFEYAQSSSIFKRLSIVLLNGFELGDKPVILLIKTLLRKSIK